MEPGEWSPRLLVPVRSHAGGTWRTGTPCLLDAESQFFHGSNARECISYVTGGKTDLKSLDDAMDKIADATGGRLYDLEDCCCDFIRWIENYILPRHDYDHLDRDETWNTSRILDHPYGRQKGMLDLGLIDTFVWLGIHPSDDYVLKNAGWTADEYRESLRLLS